MTPLLTLDGPRLLAALPGMEGEMLACLRPVPGAGEAFQPGVRYRVSCARVPHRRRVERRCWKSGAPAPAIAAGWEPHAEAEGAGGATALFADRRTPSPDHAATLPLRDLPLYFQLEPPAPIAETDPRADAFRARLAKIEATL